MDVDNPRSVVAMMSTKSRASAVQVWRHAMVGVALWSAATHHWRVALYSYLIPLVCVECLFMFCD